MKHLIYKDDKGFIYHCYSCPCFGPPEENDTHLKKVDDEEWNVPHTWVGEAEMFLYKIQNRL